MLILNQKTVFRTSPLCILELSGLTRVEKAVKNATIFVIYRVLVYIQMSYPCGAMRCNALHHKGHNAHLLHVVLP